MDPRTEIDYWDDLTTRARVRILLAQPYSWSVLRIADYLGVSRQTVYTHRDQILREDIAAEAAGLTP